MLHKSNTPTKVVLVVVIELEYSIVRHSNRVEGKNKSIRCDAIRLDMPIKSPRLQLSYNAIGKRKENVVNLQWVEKRERGGEGVGRRFELGPLRDNVALTMWGGDTQIASTFTRSRQHKCDYDYVTNVCVCVCVSAEVTFVCRWLWLDLCVCVCVLCVQARWGDSIMALMKFVLLHLCLILFPFAWQSPCDCAGA